MIETHLFQYLSTTEIELLTTDPDVIRRAMLAHASQPTEHVVYLDRAGEVEITGRVTATYIGDPSVALLFKSKRLDPRRARLRLMQQ